LAAPADIASDAAKSLHVGNPELDLGDNVHRKLPVQFPSTISPLQQLVSPASLTNSVLPDGQVYTVNASLMTGFKEFFKK
jgi:hypothetical protein